MKKSIYFYFCTICICFLFPGTAIKGQTDDAIKSAKTTVKTADDALKKFKKFSDNDSVPWLLGGDASLSFSATSLSNWAAGGEDQIGVGSIVNLFANYKKGKRTFENYGTFAYGISKTGVHDAVKNDDRIYLVSKVGHQISPKWYYTASYLTRTQFSAGYKYSSTDTTKVSDFIAPVSMYLSIGLDYRPTNNFSFGFSPIMGKATYARSNNINVLRNAGLVETEKDAAGNSIEVTKKSRYEFGGGMLLTSGGNLLKNKISYSSQVELFSNYVEEPQNIDVMWTLQVKILVYKNISADIRLDMKYDDNQTSVDKEGNPQGPKLQVKNYVGVGLFYQF